MIGKRGIEIPLPFGVGGIRDAGSGCPGGLQFEHVVGQVHNGLLDPLFLPTPEPAAKFTQRGPAFRAANVFLHQVDLRRRHVELRAALKLQFQMLFNLPVLLQQL